MTNVNRLKLLKTILNSNKTAVIRELNRQGWYYGCNSTSTTTSTTSSTSTTSTSTSTSTTTSTTTTAAPFDADAQAYFTAVETAGGTLSTSDKNAWNTYVLAKKSEGTWTKIKAVFPFMGGTAAAHAIDAVSATTMITWSGTLTHDGSGVTGNGVNGKGVLTKNLTQIFSSYNIYVGCYMRTATQQNGNGMFGTGNPNSPYQGLFMAGTHIGGDAGSSLFTYKVGDDNSKVLCGQVGGIGTPLYPPHAGFYQGNRTASNAAVLNWNNTQLGSSSVANGSALPAYTPSVLAIDQIGSYVWYSPDNISFLILGEGFSNSDLTQGNIDVEALQDALNRGVQ